MPQPAESRIEGFYRLDPLERRARVRDFARLDDTTTTALAGRQLQASPKPTKVIENVVGSYELPLGVATNFRINGHDRLVPMVVERALDCRRCELCCPHGQAKVAGSWHHIQLRL
jgi:hydroxymethylglutaryl-CoA reductase